MFRTEKEFVKWLQVHTAGDHSGLRLGIGDDAALIEVRRGEELILTTDLSIEGVHFLRSIHPARAVGHRALARSLSDIAAMGGAPRYALVSLAVSSDTRRTWWEGFYRGVFDLARRFKVAVVGGDTAIVPGPSTVDVIVAGEVERGRGLRRSTAKSGDQLFVSGRLGLSALGLRNLQTSGRRRPAGSRGAVGSNPLGRINNPLHVHLYPEPRCALGRLLCKNRLATALIDLSDGLSTDLTRLCEASHAGARLWAEQIPLPSDPSGKRLSPADALDLALNGGEDYELLFTVSPRHASRVPRSFRGVPIHRIGEITRSKGILLESPDGQKKVLQPAGYDHFRKIRSS